MPWTAASQALCPSPSSGICSKSCPFSQWWHPTILYCVIPFSSCLQSFPASGIFPVSQLLASGGPSIGAAASVLPMNIQGWFPLEWTGWISLLSKGLSRVFSNTTVQNHQFFGFLHSPTLISIESVMPSNHLILRCPLLLLPSIFPSIRVFSDSQFFASGGLSIGVSASASVLLMNIQDWFPLGLSGLISLQFKRLSKLSNTTVQKP